MLNIFGGCSNLTHTVIVGNTFYYLPQSYVGDYTIPSGIEKVVKGAFSNCTSLTGITIPGHVTNIEGSAFYGCSGLKKVTMEYGEEPLTLGYTEGEVVGLFGRLPVESVYLDRHLLFSTTTYIRSAFEEMEQLTTVTFGSHIDAIPPYLFMACKKLASVVIPGNVKTVGDYAFDYCEGMTSLTIAEGVETIGIRAFADTKSATLVSLANSVTSVGNDAFMNCGAPVFNNRLFAWLPPSYEGEYTIPEGIEEICDKAFYIASISGIHLPSSLKRIGADAFSWASNIKNVELPDNIEFISKGAFTSNVKFYAHRGTSSLLALWSAFSTSFNKCTVYDIGTDAILEAPSVNYPSVTQTTVKAAIRNMYEEYTYTSGDGATITDDIIELKGLFPETTDSLRLTVTKGNAKYYTAAKYSTGKILPSINPTITASSVMLKGVYIKGDAYVSRQQLRFNDHDYWNTDSCFESGLVPSKSYEAEYTITVVGTNYRTKQYTKTVSIATQPPQLVPKQPKVASPGNVIIAASANVDPGETEVGFEWRRIDWTDDFQSSSAKSILYDGTIEGYIRNLNAEKLWKFRAYYQAADGSKHFGDWLGIDPTNTSYFEPTVHTYYKVSVDGNAATVTGYAMRGSDNTAKQGFKYWKEVNAARSMAPTVPADAQTVEASGQLMTAMLTGLDYESSYCFVAFVTTTEGETFYGEQQTFLTGKDTSGVDDALVNDTPVETGRYDLNGRRLNSRQRGMNIIRMNDGTTHKVLVK